MGYWVYIITNKNNTTLYTGVTNNIARRIHEHKAALVPGFSSRYRLKKLVYAEESIDAMSAIQREKEIKGWRRSKKISLIESLNPEWKELLVD